MKADAKAKRISRGCENSQLEDESCGLGQPRDNGSKYGAEGQIITTSVDSSRENISRASHPPEGSDAGKMLQRLELIELSYLEYVDAHQSRLEARLDDSHTHKQQFLRQVAELKQEIYNLATEDQEHISNGHKQ